MYRKLKHKVVSTLMVAVLCAQQLFGAYHMLTKHADDSTKGVSEGYEMVSKVEAHCELCAKLDSKPLVLNCYVETVFNVFHFPLLLEPKEKTFLSTRLNDIYRRGPPANS